MYAYISFVCLFWERSHIAQADTFLNFLTVSHMYVVYSELLPSLPSPPSLLPIFLRCPSPIFMSLCTRGTLAFLSCLYKPIWVVIYWSKVYTIEENGTISPAAESLEGRAGATWVLFLSLMNYWQAQSCAGKHGCSEFLSSKVISCPDGVVLQHTFS